MNNWNMLKLCWNSVWDIFNWVRDETLLGHREFDANPNRLIFMQKITRGKTYIFISKGLVQQLISPNFDE